MPIKSIHPKRLILESAAETRGALEMFDALKDVVTIREVEQIGKRLSFAANKMTAVRTWMVENMARVEE